MTPPATPPARLTIDQLLEDRQWLERLCGRLVADAAEADDIAQESLLRALRTDSAASAHAEGKLRGWLSTTANRVMLETRRRKGRRLGREAEAAQPEQCHVTPASALAAAELREQLSRLVMALPENEREAIVLRYYEGLTPREIAAQLDGVSPNAVRQRLHRGMLRLRTDLDADSKGGRSGWLPCALAVARNVDKLAVVPASGVGATGATFAGALPALGILGLVALLIVTLSLGTKVPGKTEIKSIANGPIAKGTSEAARSEDVLKRPVAEQTRVPLTPETRPPGSARSFRAIHPSTGNPIAGAVWYAVATGARDPMPRGGIDVEYLPPAERLASGITDSDGILDVPPIEDDLYQLIFRKGEDYAAGSFAVDSRSTAFGATNLTPPTGTNFRGRLVDRAGRPVYGAEIMEYDIQEEARTVAKSNADGSFMVKGHSSVPRQFLRRDDGAVVSGWSDTSSYFARAGNTAPWVRLPTHDLPPVTSANAAQGDAFDLGDILIARGVLLRGKVLDETGRPLGGVRVGYWKALSNATIAIHSAQPRAKHPWQDSASNETIRTNEDGTFELQYFDQSKNGASAVTLVATAPDGKQGTSSFPIDEGAPLGERGKIVVSGDSRLRLILKDRVLLHAPLELPEGAPRVAGWQRLSSIKRGRERRLSMRFAEILEGDVIVIRWPTYRKKALAMTVEVQVPGYEETIVEISPGTTEQTVTLTRRPRRKMTVQLVGAPLPIDARVNVVLMSREPALRPDLSPARAARSAWPSTSYAGGLALGLRGDETVEFAWPNEKPAWIIAFPSPTGIYAVNDPTVVGPLPLPQNGSAIEISLEPFVLESKWGQPDLTKAEEVPVY